MDKPVTPARLDELDVICGGYTNGFWLDLADALRELRELRQRTEAMLPYLQHGVDCRGWQVNGHNGDCSCGLEALLSRGP